MKYLFTGLICFFSAATMFAQDYKLAGNEVILSSPIIFKTGTAELDPASEAGLKTIKKYLADKPYISLLRIECHTDNSGTVSGNQLLSEKRAWVICQELMARGVDCKRLLPVGFGDRKPVADNNTTAGKASNLRVVLVNASLKGKPIGGMPVDGGGQVAGNPCSL